MLFKQSQNGKMEEVRRFIPVSAATAFPNIAPFIESAEVTYIAPILGNDLYNQLLAFYADSNAEIEGISELNRPQFLTLLEYAQRALINLTYHYGYDFMNTVMNDAGFHRQESDTEKGLYKYQEDAIKSGFKNNGFNALDIMLSFIENHLTVFPLFRNSDNYTIRKSSLIPGTQVMDRIFDINGSRLVFLKVSRFITQVEDFEIGAVLGAALYKKVKEEISKDEPDPKIRILLPYIQRPLVHLAIARASFQLGVNVTDRGLFFESQESTLINSGKTTPLTDQQFYLLGVKAEKTGNEYLELLRGFLLAHAVDYPEYVSPGGSPLIRSNTGKTSAWV